MGLGMMVRRTLGRSGGWGSSSRAKGKEHTEVGGLWEEGQTWVCAHVPQPGGTRDNVGVLAQCEDDKSVQSPSQSPERGSPTVMQADSKWARLFLSAACPSSTQPSRPPWPHSQVTQKAWKWQVSSRSPRYKICRIGRSSC